MFSPNKMKLLSRKATCNSHDQDSPYFQGWREYEKNSCDEVRNPTGIIQMGLAENQLSLDLLESWLAENPDASGFKRNGESIFRELALFQDYHGLPAFKKALSEFMEEIRANKVTFDPSNVVLTAGSTSANETLMFCLADPGEAFLLPTPYYPGFDRDLKSRTGVEIVPIQCTSSNGFRITESALEDAYQLARRQNLRVKGILVTNPSNPLGTTFSRQELNLPVSFISAKNIHLISNEIYSGTVFSSPSFVSVMEVLLERDLVNTQVWNRVLIACSLSKDLGLPGFRVGAIYSSDNTVVAAATKMSSFGLVSSQTAVEKMLEKLKESGFRIQRLEQYHHTPSKMCCKYRRDLVLKAKDKTTMHRPMLELICLKQDRPSFETRFPHDGTSTLMHNGPSQQTRLANDNNNTFLGDSIVMPDGRSQEIGELEMTSNGLQVIINIPDDNDGSATSGDDNDGSASSGDEDDGSASSGDDNGSASSGDGDGDGDDDDDDDDDGSGSSGDEDDDDDDDDDDDGDDEVQPQGRSPNDDVQPRGRFPNGINNAILGFTGQAMAAIVIANSPQSLTVRFLAYAVGIAFYGSLSAALLQKSHPNIANTLFKIGVSTSASTVMIALGTYLPTQWYLNIAVPAVACLIIAVMVALSQLD